MSYIRTIPEAEATGKLREIYDADIAAKGYVPDYHKVMSLHPEAIEAWSHLSKTVRGKMRLRTYELVTMAAAACLRCKT